MQQTAHQIVEWCLETGCMLVIESLDFRKKKAQLLKKPKQKGYNRMISAFDYSRYQRCMENACFKAGVDLKRTDPKWTSRIGKEKYAGKLKLSIHQAASYVIARRGQGYYDRLKPVKKPGKKSKEILKEAGNREDPPDNVQKYDINDQTLPF